MRNLCLLFIGIFLASSCQKSSAPLGVNATFYYGGMTLYCACCASWFVQIDGEPNLRPVFQIPSDLQLPSSKDRTTMRVNITWQPANNNCINIHDSAIDITKLKQIP